MPAQFLCQIKDGGVKGDFVVVILLIKCEGPES